MIVENLKHETILSDNMTHLNSSSTTSSLDIELDNLKNKIKNISYNDWKRVRWVVNRFEFPYNHIIINRAFYKFWEILYTFDIPVSGTNLYCAEAPGGFIQASKMYNEKIQLIDNHGFLTVPIKRKNWNYSISIDSKLYDKRIKKYTTIIGGKGDIIDLQNIVRISSKSKCKFTLITADGGLDDFSVTFNKETSHRLLIYTEVLYALKLQKHSGCFVLKIFDSVTMSTMHLLYLLTLCYSKVFLMKPDTSRPTNSEKYVVCKNFNPDIPNLEKITDTMEKSIRDYKEGDLMYIFEYIPENFISGMRKINNTFIYNQITYLRRALTIVSEKNFINTYNERYIKTSESKQEVYRQWCANTGFNCL